MLRLNLFSSCEFDFTRSFAAARSSAAVCAVAGGAAAIRNHAKSRRRTISKFYPNTIPGFPGDKFFRAFAQEGMRGTEWDCKNAR